MGQMKTVMVYFVAYHCPIAFFSLAISEIMKKLSLYMINISLKISYQRTFLFPQCHTLKPYTTAMDLCLLHF